MSAKGGSMKNNQFVGTWKPISFELHLFDGTVMKPFGDKPVGLAIFDNNNNFMAQVMKPGRREFEVDSQLGGTSEEIKEAFEGCVAYYGISEVKDDKTVINKVSGSLFPNWIGNDQVRYYKFYDNFLELHSPPRKIGDTEVKAFLKWERVL